MSECINCGYTNQIDELEKELAKCKAAYEVLKEANDFYKDEKSWIKQGSDFLLINDSDHSFRSNSQLLSGGKRAREAAKEAEDILK